MAQIRAAVQPKEKYQSPEQSKNSETGNDRGDEETSAEATGK